MKIRKRSIRNVSSANLMNFRQHTHLFIGFCFLILLSFLVSCSSSSDNDTKTLDEKLDAALETWMDTYNIHGAAIYVYSPEKTTYSYGSGILNVDNNTEFAANSKVRIGSVTKSMTATVILQLIEEDKLSLDDTLSEFLPDYPNGDAITVEHLLRHRSGIPEIQLDDFVFIFDALGNDEKWYTPEELMEWTYIGPDINSISQGTTIPREPVGEPGEIFFYSQPGFIALGIIIESVTGQDLEAVYEERIFSNLDMSDTYLPVKDGPHDPIGYTNLFGMKDDTIPTTELVTSLNSLNSASWSAGGIVSTAPDMFKFFYALLNGELLEDTSMDDMQDWINTETSDEDSNDTYEYGMGFSRIINDDYTIIGHNGAVPGSGSVMQYIVDDDIYVIAVRNTDMTTDQEDPPDLITLIKEAFDSE